LKLSREIGGRLAGDNPESLGLHPAVYFYNERGVHTRHLFLGMVRLIAERVRNNDSGFFKKFTRVRAKLETFLIDNKSLLTQAFANINRDARVLRVRDLLDALIKKLDRREKFVTEDLFATIGISGRILDVRKIQTKAKVSEATKAAVAIATGLASASKCPICRGLLYPKKSVSYDHKVRVREGGRGNIENIQMTHPYCNTGYKN
jgi:HNH endonuclease